MAVADGPARGNGSPTDLDAAVRRLDSAWQHGRADVAAVWAEHGGGGDAPALGVLAALVKADLAQRFARGERPAAAEYLARFPALTDETDRVLSLVYEEFCLREEQGERPDTAEFCARYSAWKDSLESQLKYHRVISRVAGEVAPPPPRFPAPGATFEQFTIGRELGRGGAARVYLASDDSLGGREVVLKVSADRGSEPSILGRLEHPHIIAVHTVARESASGLRALCMPYRPGRPLDEVIRGVDPARSRPLSARSLWAALAAPSPGRDGTAAAAPGGPGWSGFPLRGSYADGVAWVVATLAEALAYAHGRKVIHRDVKPANVLLTYRDGPQLLDFNLSHDPDSPAHAEAALRGGTLPYMAPEQLEAFLDPARWGDVLAPADVYAVGLLARELLTGEAPATPDPALPPARAIRALLDRRADPRALRRDGRKLPFALESVVDHCLAFRPADRYAGAAELAEDLRLYLARRPLRYAPNRSGCELVSFWAQRHRRRLCVAAAALAVAVVWSDPLRTPVASNPVFLRAVADIDANLPNAALARFGQLGARDRNSAVVALHEAVALVKVGKFPHALAPARRVVAALEPGGALSTWAATRPRAYDHAEFLGVQFMSPSLLNNDRGTEVLDTSERLFNWTLAKNPRRPVAREGLATIAERRDQHDVAYRIIDGLIAESSALPPADAALRRHLPQRARIALNWGLKRIKPPATPSPSEVAAAVSLFEGALADLDRAEPLRPAGDVAARFDLNYLRCEALLALAAAAELRGDRAAAATFTRRASDTLKALNDHMPAQNDLFLQMAGRVKDQLRKSIARGLPASDPAVPTQGD